MKRARSRYSAGFSLVEVSLALLVIGLGMLAVFSLFPSGLSMNKRAADETQSAMFANDVLDAYRGMFDVDPNQWPKMGGPDYARNPGLGPTAGSMWKNGATVRVVSASASLVTLVYTNNWSGMAENAWRYRLTFDDVTGRAGRVKYANVQVLSGEYGRSNNMVEFYTEYYNFRSPRP